VTQQLEGLAAAGLPPPVLGFAAWLVAVGGSATMREVRERFGVSRVTVHCWTRDLEALDAAKRIATPTGTRVALSSKIILTSKRKTDGKPQRCATCGVLVKAQRVGGTGQFCALHKQTAGRSDAPWIEEARKEWRAHRGKNALSPFALHARLARRGYVAPVADYLPDGRTLRMPGLISKGIAWGYLDAEEWGRVHRSLLAGEDVDD